MPSLKELMAKANQTTYVKWFITQKQLDEKIAVKAAIKQSAYYQGLVNAYLEATKVDPLKVDSDNPSRIPGQTLWTFPSLPKFGVYLFSWDIADPDDAPNAATAIATYGSISRAANPFATQSLADMEAAHKLAEEAEQKAKAKLTNVVHSLATAESSMVKREVWHGEQGYSNPVGPTPDYTHPLTGWRVWYVAGGRFDYRLASLSGYERWAVKRADPAMCREGTHPWPAPERHCYCGYYAVNSLGSVIELLEGSISSHRTLAQSGLCFGEVSLWGKVIECEHGWRAEYAYPKRLCVFNPDHAIMSDIYGVPVTVMQGEHKDIP